ncbi:hypothetical protein [Ancylobacter polymorphus]|jgi:hypothetical protein|uniref:Uncharacterized protein n=1 Tax=Ancylobacter polymorphus TaxID=223390 RepID=A0A9E7A0L5_9HYPH|nr:hypothetical protein [Ancylobacter polymorphus]UOK70258.1 hypothetical protein K9D25_16200 [Ancylobacter polymorphus]
MRILNARRLSLPPGRSGFLPLCRFDLEPVDGVAISGCSIVQAPDGRRLVYGPSGNGGTQTVNFSPAVRVAVIEEALGAVGIEPHDRRAA